MEISEATRSVYQICRWIGFAPYSIVKDANNEIIDLKPDFISFTFGITFFLIISILTNGLFSKVRIHQSNVLRCKKSAFSTPGRAYFN